ncbi:helix-turn-helix transcriptional regulator [Nocardia salmonicida]|uniref:helix-turn-helix transcriptional regulator n=1 Tax=Nocardia salmonicida TaxID=53431 RepID=UPI0033FE5498
MSDAQEKQPDPDIWANRYTADGAADYYGVTRRTMDNLRREGGGPRYYRLFGRIVYDRADLDAYVAERKAATVTSG